MLRRTLGRAAGILLVGVPATVLIAGAVYHETKRPTLPKHTLDDLRNQTIVITGATSGIGKSAATTFAQMGATLIVGSRDKDRREECRKRLLKEGATEVVALELDLSSLESVASFCAATNEAVEERSGIIDAFVGVAAEIHLVPETTPEGIDRTFATNHLGLHALVRGLTPSLLRGEGGNEGGGAEQRRSRVVLVGSRLETKGSEHLNLDILESTDGAMLGTDQSNDSSSSPMDRYAATKHGNMLLAQSLQTKWGTSGGPLVCVLTPGMVDTSLWRHFPLWYRAVTWPLRRVALRTADDAALGIVWAVAAIEMAEEVARNKNKGYLYVSDGVSIEPSPAARDETRARRLHVLCDRLIEKNSSHEVC